MLPIQQRNQARSKRSEHRAAINEVRVPTTPAHHTATARRRTDRRNRQLQWPWRLLMVFLFLASGTLSAAVLIAIWHALAWINHTP